MPIVEEKLSDESFFKLSQFFDNHPLIPYTSYGNWLKALSKSDLEEYLDLFTGEISESIFALTKVCKQEKNLEKEESEFQSTLENIQSVKFTAQLEKLRREEFIDINIEDIWLSSDKAKIKVSFNPAKEKEAAQLVKYFMPKNRKG
jgi:hypothetical protein